MEEIKNSHPVCPEKTVKLRLQDCDAALASDDGPIFSTVAKLVEALRRSIPEGMQNAELKNEALRLGRALLIDHEETGRPPSLGSTLQPRDRAAGRGTVRDHVSV